MATKNKKAEKAAKDLAAKKAAEALNTFLQSQNAYLLIFICILKRMYGRKFNQNRQFKLYIFSEEF